MFSKLYSMYSVGNVKKVGEKRDTPILVSAGSYPPWLGRKGVTWPTGNAGGLITCSLVRQPSSPPTRTCVTAHDTNDECTTVELLPVQFCIFASSPWGFPNFLRVNCPRLHFPVPAAISRRDLKGQLSHPTLSTPSSQSSPQFSLLVPRHHDFYQGRPDGRNYKRTVRCSPICWANPCLGRYLCGHRASHTHWKERWLCTWGALL